MVMPGDAIAIELLESQTFGSFLTYFDPMQASMVPTEATITIDDNAGSNTDDLILGNLALTGDNPQFIQTADSQGEIHSHINFELSAEAEFGAYGMLFRLVSDNHTIEPSQPVWLIFYYGISPVEFEQLAMPAFAEAGVLHGDVNGDGIVNLLDVAPFVDLIVDGGFLPAADVNVDGVVDLLDVEPFVDLLTN
jgi:hypothetical protein